MIIFGGILATMYRGYLPAGGRLAWAFVWLFAVAVYFFLRTTFYLIRSYHGPTYKTLPLSQQMDDYREMLVEWHQEFGLGREAAEKEYRRYVEDFLITAADHNAIVNATKSEYLFRANTALIYCGVFVALSFVPYAVHERQRPEPVYQVQLVTPTLAP